MSKAQRGIRILWIYNNSYFLNLLVQLRLGTNYIGHRVTTPQQSRMYVDKVRVNIKNAKILADVLVRREENKCYDLKGYLHKNVRLYKE